MTFALLALENGSSIASLLWLALGVTIILYGIYSAVLLWHWKEYSTGKFTTVANMLVYLGVSAGLLILMAVSAFWFSIS